MGKKSGICLKFDISKFVHIRVHNKKNIMTSTIFYINFYYPPPMARIDTYQYNILSSRSVQQHIEKYFKMVSSYHQVWKEACSLLGFTVWNNPSHKVTLNPKPKIMVGCKSQLMCCSWFWV